MSKKSKINSFVKNRAILKSQSNRERDLKMMNEKIQDIIFKQDKNLNITYCSPSVYKVFGYTVKEVMNLTLKDLMTKESLERAFKIYNEMKELAKDNRDLEIPLMDFEYIRKDGNRFWGELKVSFTFDSNGSINGSIGVLRNITKRKKYQDLLKLSEKRYRQAFNRAEFYKDLFTHDMTNILQNIRSYAELTEILLDGSFDANLIKEYMKKIQEQVIRSASLISNVKTLYSIDEEKVILRNMDLNLILPKIISYIKDSAHEKDIDISIDCKSKRCLIKADDLIIDVLENILFNAIKHNENQKIKIEIKIKSQVIQNKKFLEIQIIDNANGIPDEMKNSLFNKASEDKDYSRGAGLGLILVKKIINRYNASIHIKDRIKGDYTQGSNFVLNIPAA